MVVLASALAVVVGLAIGALLMTIGDMRHAARQARHTAQVIAAANRAEKQLLDLETGARGYALTRDERFLGPWRSARATLPGRPRGSARSWATTPPSRPSSSRSPPGSAATSTSSPSRS